MLKYKNKLLAILLSALLVSLAGCKTEPTCEQKGGRTVFSHYITTMMMVGKVMIPNNIPQYRCEYTKAN